MSTFRSLSLIASCIALSAVTLLAGQPAAAGTIISHDPSGLPAGSFYAGSGPLEFGGGFTIENLTLGNFRNLVIENLADEQVYLFDLTVTADVTDPSGLRTTPRLDFGQAKMRRPRNLSNSRTQYDAELEFTASDGRIKIQNNPSLQSVGGFRVSPLGDGTFEVVSFFDVFVELSVDGSPLLGQLNGPTTLDLQVPEPSTFVLAGVGLGALAAWSVRRRRAG